MVPWSKSPEVQKPHFGENANANYRFPYSSHIELVLEGGRENAARKPSATEVST
jgi:hypothetical protein